MVIDKSHYCTQSTWVCFCLSVCLHNSKNRMAKLHQIFCACCLHPWLYPTVTALQYVMYLLFYRWCHTIRPMDQNEAGCCLSEFARWLYHLYVRQLLCMVEFVRMRHQRRCLLSTIALFCILLYSTTSQYLQNVSSNVFQHSNDIHSHLMVNLVSQYLLLTKHNRFYCMVLC